MPFVLFGLDFVLTGIELALEAAADEAERQQSEEAQCPH
jgi:hypothetical protein